MEYNLFVLLFASCPKILFLPMVVRINFYQIRLYRKIWCKRAFIKPPAVCFLLFSSSAKGPVQAQESFKPGNRAEKERERRRREERERREERVFLCYCTQTTAQRPSASSEVSKFNDQKSNPTKKRSQPRDLKEPFCVLVKEGAEGWKRLFAAAAAGEMGSNVRFEAKVFLIR